MWWFVLLFICKGGDLSLTNKIECAEERCCPSPFASFGLTPALEVFLLERGSNTGSKCNKRVGRVLVVGQESISEQMAMWLNACKWISCLVTLRSRLLFYLSCFLYKDEECYSLYGIITDWPEKGRNAGECCSLLQLQTILACLFWTTLQSSNMCSHLVLQTDCRWFPKCPVLVFKIPPTNTPSNVCSRIMRSFSFAILQSYQQMVTIDWTKSPVILIHSLDLLPSRLLFGVYYRVEREKVVFLDFDFFFCALELPTVMWDLESTQNCNCSPAHRDLLPWRKGRFKG